VILPAWFDHLEERFSDTVKTNCLPAENVNKTPALGIVHYITRTNQLHVAWIAAKIYSCPFPSALSCTCPTCGCLVPFVGHSVLHFQLCFEGLQAEEKQTYEVKPITDHLSRGYCQPSPFCCCK